MEGRNLTGGGCRSGCSDPLPSIPPVSGYVLVPHRGSITRSPASGFWCWVSGCPRLLVFWKQSRERWRVLCFTVQRVGFHQIPLCLLFVQLPSFDEPVCLPEFGSSLVNFFFSEKRLPAILNSRAARCLAACAGEDSWEVHVL